METSEYEYGKLLRCYQCSSGLRERVCEGCGFPVSPDWRYRRGFEDGWQDAKELFDINWLEQIGLLASGAGVFCFLRSLWMFITHRPHLGEYWFGTSVLLLFLFGICDWIGGVKKRTHRQLGHPYRPKPQQPTWPARTPRRGKTL